MEEARRKAKRDKVEAVRLQAEADEVKRKLKRLEKCFADQEDQWEQEVSQVTEYADTMNKDISDADFFRDVWREQCGYALDQQCTQLEFKRALEFANGSQMEDNTLQVGAVAAQLALVDGACSAAQCRAFPMWVFCTCREAHTCHTGTQAKMANNGCLYCLGYCVQFYMRALDMAIEVAQEDVPYNFRMFKTLAALTRRVVGAAAYAYVCSAKWRPWCGGLWFEWIFQMFDFVRFPARTSYVGPHRL